ncbi:MAG: hypothetical protein NTY19_16320 [Planctomycetota bacterium]|nr:hypothetical protein [Planctomycetota bacterium]
MATLYRKQVTKPLPKGAELVTKKGQRFARWKDRSGKTHEAPIITPRKGPNQGQPRILLEGPIWWARYRDANRQVVNRSTECRDQDAARQAMANWLRRVELVKSGVMTSGEDAVADAQALPLADHIAAYLVKLESAGTTEDHRGNVRRCLQRLTDECGLKRLADLTRECLEAWMVRQAKPENGKVKMGARTRNLHRASAVGFCNWAIETSRLTVNPLACVEKADEKADQRRKRRALSEEELNTLLFVARYRPVAERGRQTVKKDSAESQN